VSQKDELLSPLFHIQTLVIGVDIPIVAAPMAYASTAQLVAAVASAGGFGFVGAGMLLVTTIQSCIL
jgi:NAD(P)H-dependent flavin oxidoreductase YrpB (nitropropane dioxygenase family)